MLKDIHRAYISNKSIQTQACPQIKQTVEAVTEINHIFFSQFSIITEHSK